MEYVDLLQNYRAQIDTLDKEIIYLLSRRFTIVNEVWLLKKENNIPALQESRWNELLSENIEVWKELWVSESFIIDVWERIHKEALNIEK
jgi:chorismate mutase